MFLLLCVWRQFFQLCKDHRLDVTVHLTSRDQSFKILNATSVSFNFWWRSPNNNPCGFGQGSSIRLSVHAGRCPIQSAGITKWVDVRNQEARVREGHTEGQACLAAGSSPSGSPFQFPPEMAKHTFGLVPPHFNSHAPGMARFTHFASEWPVSTDLVSRHFVPPGPLGIFHSPDSLTKRPED